MTTPPDNDPSAPYVGLRPFEFHEAALFYGRGEHIAEMVRTLRKGHFLAVIGSSGSGKSSLVRAGLLPAIAAGFMDGSEEAVDWRFVIMRPGLDPYENLLRPLLPQLAPGQSLDPELIEFRRQTLSGGPRGLLEAVDDSLLPEPARLVVLVDQFEEIFRFLERDAPRQSDAAGSLADRRNAALAFVDLLLATAAERDPRVYVVLTMRSEYLGECEAFLGLSAAIAKSQFLTPRMTREQIQDIIARPIAAVGGRIDPLVVTNLLNALGTAQDQLPRVEHLLLRMWNLACEAKKKPPGPGQPVAFAAQGYRAAGGFEAALDQHAEQLYQQLGPGPLAGQPSEKQRVAEQLFCSLAVRSSHGTLVRRLSSLGEVASIAGASEQIVAEVVEHFRQAGCHFLVATPSAPLTGKTTLDISHEALLRQWARLRSWIAEEARSAERYVRLADGASRWKAGDAELLQGRDLERALEWKEHRNPTAIWAERYHGGSFDLAMAFLDKSRATRDHALADVTLESRWRPWGLLVIALAASVFLWLLTTEDRLDSKQWRPAEEVGIDSNFSLEELFQRAGMEGRWEFTSSNRRFRVEVRVEVVANGKEIQSDSKVERLFESSKEKNTWEVLSQEGRWYRVEVAEVSGTLAFGNWALLLAFAKLIAAFSSYTAIAYSGKWIFRKVAFPGVLRDVEFAGTTAAGDQKIRRERIGDAALALNTGYARFWRRAGAYMIDLVVFISGFVLSFIIIRHLYWEDILSNRAASVLLLLSPCVSDWLYQAAMIWSRRQATLGMMMMGVFVTDWKGDQVTFSRATTRHFAKILCYLSLGIGFFMQPFTAKRQALHDRLARSVVLVRPGTQKLPTHMIVLSIILILMSPVLLWLFTDKIWQG